MFCICRKYRSEIEDFIKHLLEKDRHAERETMHKLDLKVSGTRIEQRSGGRGKNAFLAPLAVCQLAYVMAQCPSCVCPFVHALTFVLNIFFSKTTFKHRYRGKKALSILPIPLW